MSLKPVDRRADQPPTLIVLNPHAGGGRAGRLWTELEPLLWEELGQLVIAVTERSADVAGHLDKAYAAGIRRVISIGGDGTNHTLVNALAIQNTALPEADRMIFGSFPVGTGQDWARGVGIPTRDLRQTAAWIARAQPRALDLGLMTQGDGREYFLNIASAGLGGEVSRRVNRTEKRRSTTFLLSTVQSILTYRPQRVSIALDGLPWFDDRAYLVVVANGTTFGHGMKIAPQARPDDGWFDVLVLRDVARTRILAALRRVYSGTHLTHPAILSARARQVEMTTSEPIGVELDGEATRVEQVRFEVQPAALSLLL